MKKKIYTFILILFVVLLLLYFVWALAANIQKEALKQHLSNEWSLNLIDENITTDGFPFKFGLKVSNFQSRLNNTPLTLIEVQCGSYLGEDDIFRYEDNYGRNLIN